MNTPSITLGAIAGTLLLGLCAASVRADPPPVPKPNAGNINGIIDSSDPNVVSHAGFWKFRTPKITKPYGDDDVLDLARGKHVDSQGCKVLWIAGGGQMYCFATLDHRETFLRNPQAYAKQAYQFAQKK